MAIRRKTTRRSKLSITAPRATVRAATANGHTGNGTSTSFDTGFDMAAIARGSDAILTLWWQPTDHRGFGAGDRRGAAGRCCAIASAPPRCAKDVAMRQCRHAGPAPGRAAQRAVSAAVEHVSQLANIAAKSGRDVAKVLGAPVSAALTEAARFTLLGTGAATARGEARSATVGKPDTGAAWPTGVDQQSPHFAAVPSKRPVSAQATAGRGAAVYRGDCYCARLARKFRADAPTPSPADPGHAARRAARSLIVR